MLFIIFLIISFQGVFSYSSIKIIDYKNIYFFPVKTKQIFCFTILNCRKNGEIEIYSEEDKNSKIIKVDQLRSIHEVIFSYKEILKTEPEEKFIFFKSSTENKIIEYLILAQTEEPKKVKEKSDFLEDDLFKIKNYLLEVKKTKKNEEVFNCFLDEIEAKKFEKTDKININEKVEEIKNFGKLAFFSKKLLFEKSENSIAENNFLIEFFGNINSDISLTSIFYTFDDKKGINIIGQSKIGLPKEGQRAEIETFFISDFWIGYGFGKCFFEKIIGHLFEKYDIESIFLSSFQESEGFYEKIGLKRVKGKGKILQEFEILKDDFFKKLNI